MKNLKMVFIVFVVMAASCSKDDNNGDGEGMATVKGRIVSGVTNEGIKNAPIAVFSEEYYKELFGGYFDIDNTTGMTDDNGYFSVSLRYSNPDNFFTFYSEDEFKTTQILNRNDRFIMETATSGDLVFEVRRLGKLKIILKNIDPFDENDSVSFTIFQGLGYNPAVYQIDNYGVENGYIENYPMNTHWVGKDVNSVIHSTLEEGQTYRLIVNTTKNGIHTNYTTEEMNTSLSILNEFTLTY